jgi:predicted dehydrogenase
MDQIRWGVLGAAKIAADLVIPAIQVSRNGCVAALASRDAAKGAAMCQRFGIPHLFGDYESLLASPEVDAIYIPLPNTLHVEWTRRVLDAGKHVLCEKPLAMRADEIDSLIELRDRNRGVVAGEAFMVVHHPQWHLVRKLLSEQRIGALRIVEASFTYYNTDPNNIRNQRDVGGGSLRDIGVYPVVTTRFATAREPEKVNAVIDWDAKFGTDRLATCMADFGDFQLSFYCSTQLARRQQMTFHGDKGWIQLDTPFNAGIYDMARVSVRYNDGNVIEKTIFPQPNHYQLMIENFGDAVQGKAQFLFPLESSRANQRVIDMLFKAAGAR